MTLEVPDLEPVPVVKRRERRVSDWRPYSDSRYSDVAKFLRKNHIWFQMIGEGFYLLQRLVTYRESTGEFFDIKTNTRGHGLEAAVEQLKIAIAEDDADYLELRRSKLRKESNEAREKTSSAWRMRRRNSRA